MAAAAAGRAAAGDAVTREDAVALAERENAKGREGVRYEVREGDAGGQLALGQEAPGAGVGGFYVRRVVER